MSKGSSGTNTVETQSGPPASVLAQYNNVIGQANQVASTPYSQYGGQMVAGFDPMQSQGFNTINQSQGIQAPYTAQAQTDLNNSQANIWNGVQQYSPTTMAQYANPYLNQAVAGTEAQINNTNQQQQQQVIGNAVASGAWGGDRSAIAQSELANQQDLAENSTISNMENTGFNQQQGEFNTQQQNQIGANEANAWLGTQGSALENNLGSSAQSEALNGAAAQINAGGQGQQLAQEELNVPYEQFQAQQAYPFQTTNWLSGISTGIGGSEGGTGSTTSPAPNALSQDVGTAAGLGTLGYLGYLALSDRRMKENIKSLGTMKGENGTYPIYSYNYKGDSRPQMGVIAQDVEKRNKDAVTEHHGLKYVNYEKLARGGSAGVQHMFGGGMAPPTGLAAKGYPSSTQPPPTMAGSPPAFKAPQSLSYGQWAAAQGAPTSMNGSATSTPASTPYTGGNVQGLTPMDQANLSSVYAPLKTGGVVPQHFDTGGGAGGATPGSLPISSFESPDVANIGDVNITSPNLSHGMGPPKAPMAYQPPQNNGVQQAIGNLSAIKGAGSGSGNPLGLSSGSQFTSNDIGAIGNDFSNSGGGFSPGEFGNSPMKRGGFVPKHFDDGGGVGGLSPDVTGSNPFVANQYAQYNNMSMEQLQQLAARMGGSPQGQIIRAALQKKQMSGGAPAQPVQGVPPAQSTPTQMQPQMGYARGGAPRHYDDGGSDNQSTQDLSDMFDAKPEGSQGLSPANASVGINPSASGDIPDHDTFMKNYNNSVTNAQPYNKPDPVLSLLSTMAGIGAGTSSKFGVNAGEGAMAGIKNYAQQNQEAAAESERRGTLEEKGEGLYNDVVNAKNRMSQENQQMQETSRHNQADESLRVQQLQQGKYSPLPSGQVLNTKTGDITGQNMFGSTAPVASGADGKPLSGQDYKAELEKTNPTRAANAQAVVDGDFQITPYMLTKSPQIYLPMWNDAKAIDSTTSMQRFGYKQEFLKGNSPDAKNIDTFNTVGGHLQLIEQAAKALDNNDTQALNSIQNTWKQQMGSALPTNLDTARTMVSGELVKAVTGAGGVTDRDKYEKSFSDRASQGQLMGAVDETKNLINQRIKSASYRYGNTVGGDYTKNLLPEVRNYLGTPSSAQNGQAPQVPPPSSAIEHLKSNPALAPQFEQKYGVKASQYLQ